MARTPNASNLSPDKKQTGPRHWILIRGLMRSAFHWHQFPKKLQQQFPSDSITCLDIPGNGERFTETTPVSIKGMAEDLYDQFENLITAKTGTHDIHIIAISMGGMIASELISMHPDHFSSVHIINSSFSNLSTPWQRMNPKALLSITPNLTNKENLETSILRWTSNKQSSEFVKPWTDEARAHPINFRNAIAQLLAAGRYSAPKSKPLEETHIYCSENDHLVGSQCSKNIAKHWQVELNCHPTAGHDLPLDDPDWLIEKISDNLNTTG